MCEKKVIPVDIDLAELGVSLPGWPGSGGGKTIVNVLPPAAHPPYYPPAMYQYPPAQPGYPPQPPPPPGPVMPPPAAQPSGSFFDRLLRRRPPAPTMPVTVEQEMQAEAAQAHADAAQLERKEDVLEQQMQQVQATEQEILGMVRYIVEEVKAATGTPVAI